MPHLFDPSKVQDSKEHKKRHFDKVKGWVLKRMPRGAAPRVSVKEVLCGDPTCAPIDTVVDLLFAKGAPRMVALPLEAQDIAEEDVAEFFPPPNVLEDWATGRDAEWPVHTAPSEELRFVVGARVECCVGPDEWAPGTIVDLWYREEGFPAGFFAPYQVELDGGNLIFAPGDEDRCVRAAKTLSIEELERLELNESDRA